MKKVLPYIEHEHITVNCWHQWFLGAVLANKKYLPWFIERFIQIKIDSTFKLHYEGFAYSLENISYYNEVFEFEEISDKSNIIETIKKAINNNWYLIISWDRYYVKGSKEYKNTQAFHGAFIIGYDDFKKEVYFNEYNINNKLTGVHALDYSLVEKAFNSSIDYIRKNEIDLDDYYFTYYPAFYVKLKDFNRSLNLYRIYNAVSANLTGATYEYQGKFYDLDKSKSSRSPFYCSGISIYKALYIRLYSVLFELSSNPSPENLKKLDESYSKNIYLCMRSLLESNNGRQFRLEYLKSNNFVDLPIDLLESNKNIIALLTKMFGVMGKFLETKNISYLEKFKNICIEIEQLEYAVLSQLQKILYKTIKDNI